MLYEYRCDECRVMTEQRRSMEGRRPGPPCPRCDSEMRLVISGAPVIFKTQGFPGNDMKGSDGKTTGFNPGRKPTHTEYEQVEAEHPEYFDKQRAKEEAEVAKEVIQGGTKGTD